MSRSLRAWTESCALVVAALCGLDRARGWRPQVRLGHPRRPGTTRSLTLSLGLVTVVLLSLTLPASSLARTDTGGHQTRTFTTTQPSQVRLVQRELDRAGYPSGPVDGQYGPLTRTAVSQFQAAHGLQADGVVGPLTLTALATAKPILFPGTGYGSGGSGAVRSLQRGLARAGFTPGPVDGRYGPHTEDAVRRFQAARGLTVDGIAGPRTLSRLPASRPTASRPKSSRPKSSRPKSSRPPAARTPRPVTPHRTPRPAPVPPTSNPQLAPAPPVSGPALRGERHRTGSATTFWIVLIASILVVLLLATLVGQRERRRRRRPGSQPELLTEPAGTVVASLPAASPPAPERPALPPAPLPPRTSLPEASRRGTRGQPWSSGQPRRGRSAFELGLMLAREGDLAGAERAFRRADQSGNARAACNLGVLLAGRGDFAEAELPTCGPNSGAMRSPSCNLGLLLEERGDLAGAEHAFRRADQRGDAIGSFNLGRLLEQRGDLSARREHCAAPWTAERRRSPSWPEGR